MRKFFVLTLIGLILVVSCKKKREDENSNGGGNDNHQEVVNIQGNWVGKWKKSQSNDEGLIHLSIDQHQETVSIKVSFDSMTLDNTPLVDTFILEGRLDEDHISGYAVSTSDDTFKCVFRLSYANDTLRGTYSFGVQNNGSWWAVRGTHLVEAGWNYFGKLWAYPVDVFFADDGSFYIASGRGLYTSQDYGLSFELVDTVGFYSVCDAGGVLYGTGFGFVLKSTDGGNTWQDITPSGFVGGTGTIVRFEDANKGYIFHADDVYSTTDGGSTWTLHEDVFPGYVQCAYVSSGEVYVGGYVPGQIVGGFASISTDGGNTWNLLNIPEEDSVSELWSIYGDGNHIVAGGKRAKSSPADPVHDLRIVLYSEDNGNTFSKISFPDTPPHDEWIGAVLYSDGVIYAGNVYTSGNVIVYSFAPDGTGFHADTLPYQGGSSKALANYPDGNIGFVFATSDSASVIYYYKK